MRSQGFATQEYMSTRRRRVTISNNSSKARQPQSHVEGINIASSKTALSPEPTALSRVGASSLSDASLGASADIASQLALLGALVFGVAARVAAALFDALKFGIAVGVSILPAQSGCTSLAQCHAIHGQA